MTTNGTSSFEFSAKKLPQQLFINNTYVDSKSSKYLTVYNPKDGSLVSDKVPLANDQDVDAAVAAAEKALPAWRKISASQRRDILLKFAALLEKHTAPLAELTRITLGAPFGSFGAFEVGLAAEAFKYVSHPLSARLRSDGFTSRIAQSLCLGPTKMCRHSVHEPSTICVAF
jgi:aldehyde dehydrogenase (NAD+)